jgi:hypothetical protein
VKIPPRDLEREARARAATRAAYAANKDRSDRIFGTAFEDVWWEQPLAETIKRTSSGDMFRSVRYNGGYPLYFVLVHGGQALTGEFRQLYVEERQYEPIILIGIARNYGRPDPGKPDRPWTTEELRLIASFFQTNIEINRKRNIEFEREHGFHEMADVNERRPKTRVSIVFDDRGLISSLPPG